MAQRPLEQLLHPILREQCLELLRRARTQGTTLIVTQGFRTFYEQGEMYAQGRSKKGAKITNAPPGYSFHNWGLAFDVAIKQYPGDTRPQDFYDGPWETVGDLGETLGLEWGGHWKHPDRPHFQNTLGWTIKTLLARWPQGLPPGITYPPT